jgi:signal transduction histidine kinase
MELDDKDKMTPILSVMDNANNVIADGTRKVTEVVDTLRNFANLDEAEQQMFDIHEGLEDTLNILQHEIKPGIRVVKQYSEVPPVYCYPAQLNQVFLNLITNANEAINGEGEITLSTYVRDHNVCIAFRDTGTGILEEDMKRIFDPGFTTKGVGVGTGLGLAICYRIVHDHKGEIEVESEVGEGTTFTVVLPLGGPLHKSR